jgi:hypothetical protein
MSSLAPISSLLKEKANRKAKWPLKRNLAKSALGWNILLENSSYSLHSSTGYQASSFLCFPKVNLMPGMEVLVMVAK